MNEAFVAAVLERGDRFELMDAAPAEGVEDLMKGLESYENYREVLRAVPEDVEAPDYFSAAEKAVRMIEHEPMEMYMEGLLRPEVEERIEEQQALLRNNRDRELEEDEKSAIATTAVNEEAFPRRALDKEEFLDRLYIGTYDVEDLPDPAFSDYRPA
ncbi:MAG: hypothetical protein ABEJ87_05685 [Candidatus Nanohalobium sp.]